jgi:hypothetical protein
MTSKTLIPICFVLFLVSASWGQGDATLTGTVTDESKAIHPGATVTAIETNAGRQYTGVSDGNGVYRLVNVQPGVYRVEAEASGFAKAVLAGIELLVGQTVNLPLTLKIASVQQSVEVQAEAPLLNTQTQEIGGNIDRRQMDQLPLLGRNWMDLSMLVKGVTANDVGGNRPGVARDDQFQMNLDGQQITQGLATASAFGQPRFSREAIAEYQLVTSLYDISQGRSVGTQVQAITRSGTNQIHGTFYGNFRRDSWNAADFVAHRVLPFSNTQLGGSFGGPVIKDKLHYFAAYEHETTPSTVILTPPIYAPQNFLVPTNDKYWSLIGRGDYQATARNQITIRSSFWDYNNPSTGQTTVSYPTASTKVHRYSRSVTVNWSSVLTNNLVQQVRAGYYSYYWKTDLADGVPATPVYSFAAAGISYGATSFYPESFWENLPSVHYDLAWHKSKHDVKFGTEFLFRTDNGYWPNNSRGTINFQGNPGDLAQRFPLAAWNDPGKWNLTGLDPLVSTVGQNFSNNWSIRTPRKEYAIYLGDTWHPLPSWTFTAGLRWDVDWGEYAPGELIQTTVPINDGFDAPGLDIGVHTGVRSLHDIAPRGGISYAAPGGWVFRIGGGVFYGTQESNMAWGLQRAPPYQISNTFVNDGKPNFVTDWARGKTAQDFLQPNAVLPPQSYSTLARNYRDPRTVQGSAGFQKQVTPSLAFDSDLIYVKGNFLGDNRNINLIYDPVTGYPRNPNPLAAFVPANGITRPLMNYQGITYYESNLHSDYLAIASSITKRFARRWQGGATYTVMIRADDNGTNSFGYIGATNNPFCMSCEWGRSNSFQRNTLRLNGVYQAPKGFSLSGIFYYGSGNYYSDGYATSAQYTSIVGGFFNVNRLVPNAMETGTVAAAPVVIPASLAGRWDGPMVIAPGQTIKRNALKGTPLYKFDLRLAKEFGIPETRIKISGMFEVFNVFNHPNYGAFQTLSNLNNFGAPQQNSSISYVPREVQLAFRAAF